MNTTFVSPAGRLQPKLQWACERLEGLALELGAGARLPTTQALRSELGVSLTTLNSALVELEGRGVLRRCNGVGVFVAAKQARTIALLCDPSFLEGNAHSPLWSSLVRGLRECAQAQGEVTEFHFSRPATPKTAPISESLERQLAQKRVHGVLGLGLHRETVEYLQGAEVPLVGFACWGNARLHQVAYAHDERFFRDGAEILREQGCRKIEAWFPVMRWMWPNYADADAHWRNLCALYCRQIDEAARQLGCEIAPRFHARLLDVGAPKMTHQEQGYALVQEVFGSNVRPDGLVFWDDLMAHGALIALHQLGVRVGVDLRVVSQANAGSPVLERESDEIVRLEFDPQIAVARMLDELESLTRGEGAKSRTQFVEAKRREGLGL